MANSSVRFDAASSILFVGNSFTFGRVDPVMSYNAAKVHDLTGPTAGPSFVDRTGTNDQYEPHPWGGVPGVFKAFTDQVGLTYDVSLSARNAASLEGHYKNSNPSNWDLRGNVAKQKWDTVVLQDNSTQALPSGAGSITFAKGSATATLALTPVGDTRVEADETIGLSLAAGSGYRLGTTSTVTGTILNDDPTGPAANPNLPTVTLSANPSAVLEDGSGKIVYTFTRSGPTTSDLKINFTAARDGTQPSVDTSSSNVDFENFTSQFRNSFTSGGAPTTGNASFSSGAVSSVTIKAGSSTAVLTLDPKSDTNIEPDESVRLKLNADASYNVGTLGDVSATIVNDDFAVGTDTSLPSIEINLRNNAVYENGTDKLVYEFSRTGSADNELTVNFGINGTATIPLGGSSAAGDFTVAGAKSFTTSGAANPDLDSFNTYAVKLAQYVKNGALDASVPANPNANAAADVYLYETWARPNLVTGARVAVTDDNTGAITTTGVTAAEYYTSLDAMTADLKTAYQGLAAANPIFKGVAPVGEAFLNAVQTGTATRDPYAADAKADGKVDLWWDDNLHASKYGSYLSALTLFGRITGLDPRSLGSMEKAAADLGITVAEAQALQNVAAATLGLTQQANWTAPGQVTELAEGQSGQLAAAGAFNFADTNTTVTHTVSAAALTAGALGNLSASVYTDTKGDGTGGAVNWSYTVDNAAVAYLAAGQTRTEQFRVTLADGQGGLTTKDIAVTINGTGSGITPPIDSGSTTPPGTQTGGQATSLGTSVDPVAAQNATNQAVSALPAGIDTAAVEQAVAVFLAGLPTGSPVNVSTFTPTPGATDIRIDGPTDGTQSVVVLNASAVPAGTPITLNNVGFVAVSGPASLVGGDGSQVVYGDDAAQSMVLGADDDTLHGGGGNDVIGSKGGNDMLYGDAGNDTVFGGIGNDSLLGGTDQDLVYGNQDADLIYGNQGQDTLYGGQGDDRAYGGQGDDRVFGNAGNDVLFGNLGADIVYGNQGADIVYGNQGADILFGGQGNDVLYGGQGADTLVGGIGDDILVGGLGADLYRFDPNSGRDLILGFNQGEGDRIALGGQTYTVSSAQNGDALLTLSGGGVVDLAGVRADQVNASYFAA